VGKKKFWRILFVCKTIGVYLFLPMNIPAENKLPTSGFSMDDFNP
jgi:hypothetical protein